MNDCYKDIQLLECPHCGEPSKLLIFSGGAHITCENRNCMCSMNVHWGGLDNPKHFIDKLISDWNKRTPTNVSLNKAIQVLEDFCNSIHEENQNEYSEYFGCCEETLEEAIAKIRVFTR